MNKIIFSIIALVLILSITSCAPTMTGDEYNNKAFEMQQDYPSQMQLLLSRLAQWILTGDGKEAVIDTANGLVSTCEAAQDLKIPKSCQNQKEMADNLSQRCKEIQQWSGDIIAAVETGNINALTRKIDNPAYFFILPCDEGN